MAIALNVPASNGIGAASDVSGLDPDKTFVIGGTLAPGEQLVIEGTCDPTGANGWVGVAAFDTRHGGFVAIPPTNLVTPSSGQNLGPGPLNIIVNWMRVKRVSPTTSTTTPTVSVDATVTATQAFQSIPVPAGTGNGANVNVGAQGTNLQATVSGTFGVSEIVALEGSADGVTFDFLWAFRGPGTQSIPDTRYTFVRASRRGIGNNPQAILMFLGTSSAGAGGGGFPGYSPTAQSTGTANNGGASPLVSRGDHVHAVGFAIPVDPGDDNPQGLKAQLAPGAALFPARLDHVHAAYRTDLPLSATWFIDPVNGNDANAGTSSGAALRTLGELKKRWWSAEIAVVTTITILGDIPAADTNAWNFRIKPGILVHFVGTLGATTGGGGAAVNNTLYSGSVTGFVAGSNGPAAQDIELTDAAIPVSYTASGLLASGVLFKRTNSTARYWYGLKDLGAKTLRTTVPLTSDGVVTNNMDQTLTVGDTYVAYALWTFPRQDWGLASIGFSSSAVPNAGTGQLQLTKVREIGIASGPAASPGITIRHNAVWIDPPTSGTNLIVDNPVNCLWNAGATQMNLSFASPVPAQIFALNARGTGAGQVRLFGIGGINGPCCFQGTRLGITDNSCLAMQGPLQFNDVTGGDCIELKFGAKVLWDALIPAGAGLSGLGNTGKLLSVDDASGSTGSTFQFGGAIAIPAFALASTTDTTPIRVGSLTYTPAQLPLSPNSELTAIEPFPGMIMGGKAVLGFESVEIDMTALSVGNIVVPVIPGYYFVPVICRWVVTLAGGVAATPPTVKVGNNATHDGLIAAAASPTTANHLSGVGTLGSATAITTGLQTNLGTAITAEVTAAATGGVGFTYKAKLVAVGYLKSV